MYEQAVYFQKHDSGHFDSEHLWKKNKSTYNQNKYVLTSAS